MKNALVEGREESKKKDDDLKALEENFLILKETVDHRGYRYDKTPAGGPQGHPYCPVCMQKEGYMFHTTNSANGGRMQQCPNCKAEFSAHVFGYE